MHPTYSKIRARLCYFRGRSDSSVSALVISRHSRRFARCPLFPQKRTSAERIGMSVKGQQATSDGSQPLIRCEPETHPRLQR